MTTKELTKHRKCKRQQQMRMRMKRDEMLYFWMKMMIIWSWTLMWMKFRVILDCLHMFTWNDTQISEVCTQKPWPSHRPSPL
jgi:hypothetical protein